MAEHYLPPTTMDRTFNRMVGFLTRHGVSVYGSRVLFVRGRRSGQWRSTPVNPLVLDGQRYLIAPRGTTEWVRNLRAGGTGELRLGRRVEPFVAAELADAAKPPIIRRYVKKWKWEVGRFITGVNAESTDGQLLEIASAFSVFAITV